VPLALDSLRRLQLHRAQYPDDKTMTFTELLTESAGIGPAEQQVRILSRLPTRAQERGMRAWKPGDGIPTRGRRFLIGVEPFSSELSLLDSVCEALKGDQLDVFTLRECKSQSEIEDFIPGIAPVYQSPVVGIWQDGRLAASGSGWNAIQLLAGYGVVI
jgi:hypothetical protein